MDIDSSLSHTFGGYGKPEWYKANLTLLRSKHFYTKVAEIGNFAKHFNVYMDIVLEEEEMGSYPDKVRRHVALVTLKATKFDYKYRNGKGSIWKK